MRLALIPLLLFLTFPASAEEGSPPAIKWQPAGGGETRVRNIVYVPETAGNEWNIARAANLGSDVFRFEVRGGDQWAEDKESGENKERSELDGYKVRFDSKNPVWGSYSFFIEPGAAYHSDWTGIGQMHGSLVRSFHIQFTNEILKIYSEHLGKSGPVIDLRYTGKLDRNVWHHVTFHLVQSSADNGLLELWLDKKKIIDFSGAIGADGNKAYWKFGIYRGYGPISTPFAVQYANMEVGSPDLRSRIESPLEIK